MLRNLVVLLSLGELSLLASAGKVTSAETDSLVTLENGYSKVSFSKRFGHIDSIAADFSGSGAYSDNILSDSFGLDVRRVKGNCLQKIKPIPTVEWIEKSDRLHKVKISNVFDCEFSPVVSETWTISLSENQRSIEVTVDGAVLQDAEVESITHSLYLTALSAYGLFERGVAQMMGAANACLGSTLPLERAYFLGGGSALDFLRNGDTSAQPVVLLSQGDGFNSGLQSVIYGSYPNEQRRLNSAWNILCWADANATTVKAGDAYSASYSLIPNSADFPVYLLNDVEATQSSLPTVDMQSYLTGIYASPVGCLQSYYDQQTGIIAPTVAHPDIGYSPDANFFDPDNFLSLSALLASGDAYLLDQVRGVLERTAETMCGIGSDTIESYCNVTRQRLHHTPLALSQFQPTALRSSANNNNNNNNSSSSRLSARELANSRTGQLMHHFVSLVPTYESIAGSEQLGPNIFWTLTALKYIATTQDNAWAVQMFDYIYLSAKFLLTFFDPSNDLIYAPGPLWIDVIVRENYTSDSGAMMVPVLLELADYFDFVSILQDAEDRQLSVRLEPGFTAELRDISSRLAAAINKHLWSDEGDHYLTQLNPDGTSRDFIDYDSNLLTVAYGIAPADRQAALLARVDGGEHTHIRATWCSEVPYTGDACDCYIVGGTVCGDSVVTLARIGWVDAMARKAIGDQKTFDDVLLAPLQADLIADTWLYERYDENGTQIRTSYYFEYPSLVTMLLHDIRYGIAPGLATFDLDPFPAAPFTLSLGSLRVVYGPEFVSLQLPSVGSSAIAKRVTVHSLSPLSTYVISNSCVRTFAVVTAVTDDSGLLAFTDTFGEGCVVTATKQ